jgi:hypothetical protein
MFVHPIIFEFFAGHIRVPGQTHDKFDHLDRFPNSRSLPLSFIPSIRSIPAIPYASLIGSWFLTSVTQ